MSLSSPNLGARIAAVACCAGLAVGGTACIGPEVDAAADVETGTTRALIQVESVADGEEPEARALAVFAQIPAEADAEAVLDLVGWRQELPPVGSCAPLAGEPAPIAPDVTVDRVDFLEVGDVAIRAGNTKATLAPRAFPTVSDLIGGVVYTTRDGSADPLPPGVPYEIVATGGSVLPSLALGAQAPNPLAGLRVGGTPFDELVTLRASAPLDLTWEVGASGDLVLVELALDNSGAIACTFADELGAASVPAGVLAGSGNGWLTVHRIRVVGIETDHIDGGELRFDLEREIDVVFTR